MHVHLLGDLRIYTDARTEINLRPTAARLFAFLVLHRHATLLREVVAELFWEEAELQRARKSLNTTLWQLGNALSRANERQAAVIQATPEQIRIHPEAGLQLDVASFEEKAEAGLAVGQKPLSPLQLGALEEAVALYQGDLLVNFYDAWALQERERLRLIYLRCLTRLMTHHQSEQNLQTSIDYGRRILRVEPWREDVHRRLMALYAQSGRRGEALAQYRLCRQILAEELDVSPLPETEALYQALLKGPTVGILPALPAPNQPAAEPTLAEATAQLHAAIQTMQAAQRSLEEAMALVERLSRSESTGNSRRF